MAGLLARVLMNNSAGLYPPARNGNGTTRKRRRKKVATAKRKKRARTSTAKAGKGRLKKGSAAAKRYMASIRRKRRK